MTDGPMKRDRPTGDDLLETARAVLRERVAAGLKGEARFEALMVANAMAIAARELKAATDANDADDAASKSDLAALARDIRAGAFDAGEASPRLHARLLADVRARLALSNPRYLAQSDKESDE